MSTRWPGGIINQTAPVPAGSFATSSAPGLWTLEQQAYWKQQGLWPIPGNLPPNIEDVFSTFLYTGTGGAQPIVNGLALGNASNSQFSLKGYTVTNLGAAFNTSFSMQNLTDGIVETTNAANLAYVSGAYFDVYVDLVNPAVVTAYNIAPQGTANTIVYNTPTAFIVKASNNASTWTTITTFTGISQDYPNWNAGTFRVFSFANTTAYRYWRLENTTLGATGSGVAISEWNLTGTTTATVRGGLVWLKNRTSGASHWLADTVRGPNFVLESNTTGASVADVPLSSFNANGFTTGPVNYSNNNASGQLYCSWTFAEQPKFFDIVTYTGTGSARTVAHNLGSVPGMMIIKRTDSAGTAWFVYHRSTGNTQITFLNTTDQALTASTAWDNTSPTSSVFTVGTNAGVNASGGTYIAYLFAHNAGGFGTSGTDNVISCGSFTCPSSGGVDVNLGYEPQYILMKKTNGAQNWVIYDVMRGWAQLQQEQLYPNLSSAADSYSGVDYFFPTATGFRLNSSFGLIGDYIYMAIRRPTGVPTLGTQVFSPVLSAATTGTKITTGFPIDLQIWALNGEASARRTMDRLRGVSSNTTTSGQVLFTNLTDADSSSTVTRYFDNTGYQIPATFVSGLSTIYLNFRRAPGFFDVVCYTGTGSATTQAHNLTVAPELIIVKNRSFAGTSWCVYSSPLGNTKSLFLDNTVAPSTNSVFWNNTSPTSSVFSIGSANGVNRSTDTFVAYLFATLAGVSKVGSYTGTGATQTINCGFTTGARFVLIKRTDSTGDWWTWDTARGMVSGTDPRFSFNTQDAPINNNWVFTESIGFQIVTSDSGINASGGSYIFLAIA